MPWQRETEFKEVLDKAVKKGSKGAIDTVQKIALEDMGQCYKHVCALTERQMRKAKPAQRLNALYVISTICRHSLKKHKLQDKYTGRWGPSIASLIELVADLPSEQTAQVEKVLTSWKKEKIFSEAIVDQCASNIGLTITKSGLLAAPSGVTDYAADGNEINSFLPPALSAFSEPSAGSVDLAGLDSFPPKTVASANMEPPRVVEATSMPPASNASTGSSRPPEPTKPIPPADLYDPTAAESYDCGLFSAGFPPAESPLVLPPLPSMMPISSNAAAAATAAAFTGAAAAQPQISSATGTQAAGLDRFVNGSVQNRRGGIGNGLPPPPAAAGLTQTPPASRKRKSRWEDAAPAAAAAQPAAAATAQPETAAAGAPAAAGGSSGAAAAAEFAEPRTKARRSRFTDAPPAHLPLQSGQGSAPQPPLAVPGSMPSMQPPPPPPPMESAIVDVLPPKPASARQDGEAQAAAALEAVEQMLQAKRHSEARNIIPSTSRPKQAPMPPHQPPLPRAPPPQPPLPQLPPPQPAFTEGPAWQTGHANHAGHAMPPFQSMPPVGFPGPAFPHLPPMLQQGLQRGLQPPHLGHHVPQHFVQAGLQQHHRPAPPHHLPSMLQHQAAPPLRQRPPAGAPPPPPYMPRPPKPQWQGSSPTIRQQSIEQVPQRPSRPAAAPSLLRRESSEADLGHFQTTSIAMDTPTDTSPDPSWRLRRPQPSVSGPAEVPGPPPPPAGSNPSAEDVPASSRIDDAVPSAPPSPPADLATTPPTPPPPASTAVTPVSSAAFSVVDDDRTATASLETQPAPGPSLTSGASAAAAPARATASEGSTLLPSDLVAATTAEAEDDAHAAAPAGPAEESTSPMLVLEGIKNPAEVAIPEPVPDEEMDMSDG